MRVYTLLFLFSILSINCFSITWGAAWPYSQSIEGQDITIKAIAYAPYNGPSTLGRTRVYKKGKFLYEMDTYFRKRIFPSDNGQYLAIVNQTIGIKVVFDSINQKKNISLSGPIITIYKNGEFFKNFYLEEIIDNTEFIHEAKFVRHRQEWIFPYYTWTYQTKWKRKLQDLEIECESCLEVYGKKTLKNCPSNDIEDEECISCNNSCDSLKLGKIEENLAANSVFVKDNTLCIINDQGNVITLSFESLKIEIFPLEQIIPQKNEFDPPKVKRFYRKRKLPEQFTEPKLKDGSSLDSAIAQQLGLEISQFDEKEDYTVFIHFLILDQEGKCIRFVGNVYDQRKSSNFSLESPVPEKAEALNNWIRDVEFDKREIPRGYEKYSSSCVIRLKEASKL